jgi:hypothetical protein
MPESNDRGRVSFEDVAKLARTPETPQGAIEERSENSGLINLTAMIAGEAKPPPNAREMPESPVLPPAAIPVLSPQAPTPTAPQQKRRDGRVWTALATGVALGLLAAGVIVAMRGKGPSAGTGPVLAPQGNFIAAEPAAASKARPPLDRANAAAAAPPAVSNDLAVDPSARRVENGASATIIGPVARASNTAYGRDPALLPQTTASPPSTAQAKMKTTGAPAGSPTGTPAGQSADDTLEGLIKRSVGPGAQTAPTTVANVAESPRPAGDSLPAKPALGAVQGALGTVLPGARSCLGADDPVSRATITFKSDGSVQAVAVSGHASGEPAEECIRSRLMAARIPPFASPTFTWTVTVRPAT